MVVEGSLRFLPLVSSWLKLHPLVVFPHLNPEALRLQLTTSQLWRTYSSQAFRMHNYFAAINRRVPISSSLLTKFRNLRVHLPVRTLGYRTFHRLLPTAQWLHQIGIRDSPLCTYCRQIESHNHFIAECPVRWNIWVEILVAYFPHHYFTPTEVIDILQLTALPTSLASSTSSLLTVVFTTHWVLWVGHWRSHFDAVPIVPETLLNRAISFITRSSVTSTHSIDTLHPFLSLSL